jgi:anti-anti-sigma factor
MSQKIKVLKPSGIFDGTKASEFRQEINDLVQEGIKYILIDLKKVSFMDSSGLGALVLILKTVRTAGGRLFLTSINEQIKMLFELTNMDKVFEIISDKEDLEQRLFKS